ncbi:MAG: DUF2304 domain-containing protein [Coriobacteriales bacterium]|nr:DUF2304 domain-containing protein [Coriobacteriales bacterium]
MSLTLRLLCVVGAAITFFGMARQIRKAKIKIEDSIFWVLLSGLLLLIAIFPRIASFFSHLFGFQATSNFVFCGLIAILLVKEFHNTMQISLLKHKVTELAQEMALEKKG